MKPILIIAYYFPPASFVGGDRAMSWLKHFHKFGYYPIVITRQWDENQKDETITPKLNNLKIEKFEIGEIHRLPHLKNLRDYIASSETILSRIFRKFLTFIELILMKFTINFCPYRNLYHYSNSILKTKKDCQTLLITGKPFNAFHFGYLLKKEYPKLNWFADYRDEWTTNKNRKDLKFLDKVVFDLDKWSEKRWLSNASGFTSTAQPIVDRIEKFTQTKGKLILNGYENIQIKNQSIKSLGKENKLTLLYSGTLYHYQSIDIIIESIKEVNQLKYKNFTVELLWIGIDVIPIEQKRVIDLVDGDKNFIILPRMSKEELEKYYESCDCFFLTAYNGHKGWLPVKIFDYLAFSKPILLVPSDKDSMHTVIEKSQAGFTADNVNESKQLLLKLITEKHENGVISTKLLHNEIAIYSRENQAREITSFFAEQCD